MPLAGLLQPLLSQLNSGVVLLDAELKLVFINQFIARRADLQPEDVKGKSLFEVFSDLPQAWLQRKLHGVLSLQVPAFSSWEQRQYIFKLPHLRPLSSDSAYMAQNCSMLPLTAADTGERYICILVEDATDAYVYQQQLQHSVARLQLANRTDGLTGVFNRSYWQQQLGYEIQRAERYQHPLSLLLFDLDKFKQLNDHYGHLGGDAVLIEVARLVAALLRDTDLLGRYGGEEFGIILPETDLTGAMQVAQRLCSAVAAHRVAFEQQQLLATISLGVTGFTSGLSSDQLIQQADEALYSAKRQGRNQAVAWRDSQSVYLKKVK
ncbi:sensor domain-containing diguanylate cyclase [Rheinheimera nanhaiensis]|uniref:diguanylate cyclase n=1 Tax=Rheinheimera nanhaiensis E407-8 TaxID=562729 RepID=I1DTE6_9GAMM|nr:sensor domain-containing diguanylate cyclase [Rheinheimera nanhaiensis]GAB57324.1 GGDEF domain-containing protein [Rheinheimera nanhaiensis E407-8]